MFLSTFFLDKKSGAKSQGEFPACRRSQAGMRKSHSSGSFPMPNRRWESHLFEELKIEDPASCYETFPGGAVFFTVGFLVPLYFCLVKNKALEESFRWKRWHPAQLKLSLFQTLLLADLPFLTPFCEQ
jgi:hypothetical protein